MTCLRDSVQTCSASGLREYVENPSPSSYCISITRGSRVCCQIKIRSSNGRFGKTVNVFRAVDAGDDCDVSNGSAEGVSDMVEAFQLGLRGDWQVWIDFGGRDLLELVAIERVEMAEGRISEVQEMNK